jgi:hypothetical protein
VVAQPPPAAAPEAVARRDVQALCAAGAGGVLGEPWCHARECRKPEHQRDPVCVRLRDNEAARLQQGAQH